MKPGVLPKAPKQSDRFLNGLLWHPLGRWNLISKAFASTLFW